MRRELLEETGCQATTLVPLGQLDVDSGRLQTTMWAYYAPGVVAVASGPQGEELDLELLTVTPSELTRRLVAGEFRMAAHLALIAAAAARGLFALELSQIA